MSRLSTGNPLVVVLPTALDVAAQDRFELSNHGVKDRCLNHLATALYGAGSGTRTLTILHHLNLNQMCLPIPPIPQMVATMGLEPIRITALVFETSLFTSFNTSP